MPQKTETQRLTDPKTKGQATAVRVTQGSVGATCRGNGGKRGAMASALEGAGNVDQQAQDWLVPNNSMGSGGIRMSRIVWPCSFRAEGSGPDYENLIERWLGVGCGSALVGLKYKTHNCWRVVHSL